jgi:hypothetical protein
MKSLQTRISASGKETPFPGGSGYVAAPPTSAIQIGHFGIRRPEPSSHDCHLFDIDLS